MHDLVPRKTSQGLAEYDTPYGYIFNYASQPWNEKWIDILVYSCSWKLGAALI